MFQNFNQKKYTEDRRQIRQTDVREGAARNHGPFSFQDGPSAWSPLLPAGGPGHSVADALGDSGPAGKPLTPPQCPSAKPPNPGPWAPRTGARARPDREDEASPYRGRSVLLCRVFRAVPSSRGRALCRLHMATVFLRSITA